MSSFLSTVGLPIETPRLKLRLPATKDVPELRRIFRDRRVREAGTVLHLPKEMADPAELVARVRRGYREGWQLTLLVTLRDGGACIGEIGLSFDRWWGRAENLSYWVLPAQRGHGFAREASWALCRASFDRLKMRRIGTRVLATNLASLAILRRLGFVEEGRERECARIGGKHVDLILLGALKRELVRQEGTTGPRRA